MHEIPSVGFLSNRWQYLSQLNTISFRCKCLVSLLSFVWVEKGCVRVCVREDGGMRGCKGECRSDANAWYLYSHSCGREMCRVGWHMRMV